MKRFKQIIYIFVVSCCFVMSAAAELPSDKQNEIDIVKISQRIRMSQKLPLYFSDAQSGSHLGGVKVTISGVGTFTTDKSGFIRLPQLADDDYEMTASKQGYIGETFTIEVRAGFIPQYRFCLTKSMIGDYIRIVLTWGDRPNDLDLHLEKDGGYHISYRNMHFAEDGAVMLDRDDTDRYGPETITMQKRDTNKLYTIYIVDYTNRSSGSSNVLSRSNAVVRVYNRDKLLKTYYVPTDTTGNRWNICTIVGDEITDNNTVVTNF